MEHFRKTFAEINLSHLKHNIDLIINAFPVDTFICPMVKANAYGHGDVIIAKALDSMGIQNLGVCLIEEALWLKQAGIKSKILVFRGFDQAGAQEIVDQGFIPVVSQWEHLEFLEKVKSDNAIRVHLKFDTGMNRLGFRTKEADKLYDYFWSNKKILLKGILTHFHSSEESLLTESTVVDQLKLLLEIKNKFKSFDVVYHCLNSSAVLGKFLLQSAKSKLESKLQLESNVESKLKLKSNLLDYNWGLRPGLMIYGYHSELAGAEEFLNQNLNDSGLSDLYSHKKILKPVMTLKSQISDIKLVNKNEGVSYSHKWKASRDSLIGIIPIGYADGIHRLLSNKGTVLVAGESAPIIGNICMDYLMVDLSNIKKEINKNAEVILFGFDSQQKLLSAEDAGKNAQTITWEILTSVGIRVPRIVV